MNTREYSFWKLISEYNIEIPAIQRDYAQGRKTESRIANTLIDDMYDVLTSKESIKMNLHFIYGKTENYGKENNKIHLIPLDGQQRLTTLFLLHWFLSTGLSVDDLKFEKNDILSKFKYETRPSAEDFCLKLVKESINYEKESIISEQIKNSKWFFLSWKNDPTIMAMLNMLDIIQQKFKEPNLDLFKKLIKEDSPLLFHFLPLEKFKLDDRIYVKMNSRGKPLTEFENFKANFSALFDIKNKSKFDNEWLDIFWQFEKDKEKINIDEVDRKYLNFLKNITMNFYVERKDAYSKFRENFNIFDKYKDVYSSDAKYLEQLSIVMDSLNKFADKDKYFENFINENPDYTEMLKFYALMRFFIKIGNLNDSNTEIYEKWMRVCANLINNTLIQSPDDFSKAIRSIEQLSKNIDQIYEYLQQKESKIGGFLQKQVAEEKYKAKLILQDENWRDEIYNTENHNYFNGQIGFIFDLSEKDKLLDFDLFKDYAAKLKILFGEDFKDNKDCLFQRALLTFGDFSVPISISKTFCTFNEGLREKTDNWRKVFDDEQRRILLKKLLDKINLKNIEVDLLNLIEGYAELDWKCLFIKNKGVLEYCNEYRIANWGNKIALSRSSANYWRRHAELYSYVLYLKLKMENQNVYYIDASDAPSWISIKWKNKDYYIQENENDYEFGLREGNYDEDGLAEMREYVEKIIEINNLQKYEL